MTTLGYDAYLPLNGRPDQLHVPCDLTVDVGEEYGEPYLSVTAIKVDGSWLPAKVREPGSFEQHLAYQILNAAFADDELARRAFEAAGWHRSPSGWKREPDVDAVREFREAAE